jgi:hypothetical protein
VDSKYGVGGVQMRFMGHMGWDYVKISGEARESFLVIPNLMWEMAPRLGSCITSGVGDWAFKEAFPDLYSIAHAKDAFVAKQLELCSDSHQWNVSFNRAAHDWYVDVSFLFLNLL